MSFVYVLFTGYTQEERAEGRSARPATIPGQVVGYKTRVKCIKLFQPEPEAIQTIFILLSNIMLFLYILKGGELLFYLVSIHNVIS